MSDEIEIRIECLDQFSQPGGIPPRGKLTFQWGWKQPSSSTESNEKISQSWITN